MDFICRKKDNRIKKIRKQYDKAIFISYGKSPQLEKIPIKNFRGTVFIISRINQENIDGIVIKLPLDIKLYRSIRIYYIKG